MTIQNQKHPQTPDTYNDMYKTGGFGNVFSLHYKNSCYYPLFKHVLKFVIKKKPKGILEVGCGSGALAHLLLDNAIHNYKGFDFSQEAVAQAYERTGHQHLFFQGDATQPNSYNIDMYYDTIICTEVLEHVPDDISVIKNWENQRAFIASVPNFDSDYHERFFTTPQEVCERYSPYLNIENISIIKKPYLADISLSNYIKKIKWNRYKPKELLKILGLGNADEVGCWFVFSGTSKK